MLNINEATLNQISCFIKADMDLAFNFARYFDKADHYEQLCTEYLMTSGFRFAEASSKTARSWGMQRGFYLKKAFGALCTLDGVYAKHHNIEKVIKEYIPFKEAEFSKLSPVDQSVYLVKMIDYIRVADAVLNGLDIKDLRDLEWVA